MAEERKSLSHAILFLYGRCVDRKAVELIQKSKKPQKQRLHAVPKVFK